MIISCTSSYNRKFNFIAIGFGVIYLLICLLNHYNFRTPTLDLGNYNQVLYHLSIFSAPRTTLTGDINYFSDHFEPILFIFAPLRYLFGTYTLLIVQSFFLIIAAYGIKFLVESLGANIRESFFLSLTFLSFYSVFMAVECEYHSNVIGVCLIPWFIYFIKKENYLKGGVLLLLILFCRENTFIALIVSITPLLFENVFNKSQKQIITGAIVFALVYFMIVTKLIMPYINADKIGEYQHLASYSRLTVSSVTNIFLNISNQKQFDYFKIEFLVFTLLSGWAITIIRPVWFIALLPIILQKLLHNDALKWGIYFHYSIDGIWVVILGVYFSIKAFKKANNIFPFLLFFGVNLILTIRSMDNTVLKRDKCKLRLYQACHYSRNFDTQRTHNLLKTIFNSSSGISAQDNLVSHLAFRNNIRKFPDTTAAEFIVLNPSDSISNSSYNKDFKLKIEDFLKSGIYKSIINEPELLVLQKLSH